jgi:hypothetical protein
MTSNQGRKVWVFPDAELPPKGNFELKGHESIIILNMNDIEATIKLTLYFTDSEPYKDIIFKVGANRVRCIRTDNVEEMGGFKTEQGVQYAMKLESDVPVVMQYGRLDTRDQPIAFYTTCGFYQ